MTSSGPPNIRSPRSKSWNKSSNALNPRRHRASSYLRTLIFLYLDLTKGHPIVSSLIEYAVEGLNIRCTKSRQRASRQRKSRYQKRDHGIDIRSAKSISLNLKRQ